MRTQSYLHDTIEDHRGEDPWRGGFGHRATTIGLVTLPLTEGSVRCHPAIPQLTGANTMALISIQGFGCSRPTFAVGRIADRSWEPGMKTTMEKYGLGVLLSLLFSSCLK
jgi:hypothetical protein